MRRRRKRRFPTEGKFELVEVRAASHKDESLRTDHSDEPLGKLSAGFREIILQMRPEVPEKAVDTHRDGDISQSLEMRKRTRRRWKRKDPSLAGGSVLW